MIDLPGWSVVVQVVNWLGPTTVVTWVLYHRVKLRNENRKGSVDATVEEENLPNRLRSSSNLTLEAELVAAAASFERDRAVKDATIVYLRNELEEARHLLDERDERIERCEKSMQRLRIDHDKLSADYARVTRSLEAAERELAELKSMGRPDAPQ